MSSVYFVLFALRAVLRIAALIAILVYAVTQRRRAPRASMLVILGASFLLATDVFGQAIQMIFARTVNPNSLPFVIGLVGLFTTLAWIAGLTLIVMAAFSNERQLHEQAVPDFVPSDTSRPARVESGNPYEPPT